MLDEPVADELAAAAAAADKSAATPAEPVVPVLSLMLMLLRLLPMRLRLSPLLRVSHSAAVSESACPSAVVGAEAVGYGAVPAVRTDLLILLLLHQLVMTLLLLLVLLLSHLHELHQRLRN